MVKDKKQGEIDWDTWYENAVNNAGGEFQYFKKSEEYNKPLIDAIKNQLPPPQRILEVGVGFGFTHVMLKNAGYDVVGIDTDQRALDRTRAIVKRLSVVQEVQLFLCDAFDLRSCMNQGFNACFSSGVMEHFSLEEAVRFLQEQRKVAEYVITAVPSWNVKEDFEAFHMIPYTPKLLRHICEEAGLSISRELQYGYHSRRMLLKTIFNPSFHTSKLGRMTYALGQLKRSNRAWTLVTICRTTKKPN